MYCKADIRKPVMVLSAISLKSKMESVPSYIKQR